MDFDYLARKAQVKCPALRNIGFANTLLLYVCAKIMSQRE